MTQITATIKKQTILATVNKRSISVKASGNIILAKPAGENGAVQFNDNGAFGSFGGYNKTTGELNLTVLNLSGQIENDSQAITLGFFNSATSSFLTSESDPIFTASPAHGILGTDISNWNEAHGWGNHSGLYSLLAHNHSGIYEPANTASGLLSSHNTAFNHSKIASAIQSETDPIFNSWLVTTPPLYNFTESDPVWNSQKSLYALLTQVWKLGGNANTAKKLFGSLDNFDIGFITNSTEKLTILANGNVGIGTTAPISKLTVADSGVSKDASGQYNGGLTIYSSTGLRSMVNGAQLEFVIPANTDGTNAWGQGRIMTVAGNTLNGDASGMMILGTRRMFNKTGSGSNWYYGDDLTINSAGNVGIGIASPTALLDVNSNILRLRTAKTPVTAGDSGNIGDHCWDNGFLYVCVATNTWKRSALGTW